jgi:hypothetical protein
MLVKFREENDRLNSNLHGRATRFCLEDTRRCDLR